MARARAAARVVQDAGLPLARRAGAAQGVGGVRRGAAGPCRGTRLGLERRDPLRSEEHTSELQSRLHLVFRLLLVKKMERREEIAVALDTGLLPTLGRISAVT